MTGSAKLKILVDLSVLTGASAGPGAASIVSFGRVLGDYQVVGAGRVAAGI